MEILHESFLFFSLGFHYIHFTSISYIRLLVAVFLGINRYRQNIMQNCKINSQVCIYYMADLNGDNCVEQTFEGKLGINYNFKNPATKIVTQIGEVNTETCDDLVLQRDNLSVYFLRRGTKYCIVFICVKFYNLFLFS